MEKGYRFENPNGKDKDSAPFAGDQKHLNYRRAVKAWREKGFSRELSRIVASVETRKPKEKKNRE